MDWPSNSRIQPKHTKLLWFRDSQILTFSLLTRDALKNFCRKWPENAFSVFSRKTFSTETIEGLFVYQQGGSSAACQQKAAAALANDVVSILQQFAHASIQRVFDLTLMWSMGLYQLTHSGLFKTMLTAIAVRYREITWDQLQRPSNLTGLAQQLTDLVHFLLKFYS